FHEVGHGLGIKNTINGKGAVRTVLSDQYSAFEEGKADILGLFLVSKLTEMGEMGEKDLMDNFVTFMAGIFRSVRFGATSSHGKANMVRFNYFEEEGAFSRDAETGTYSVNFDVMYQAMLDLSNMILIVQGDGDYDAAKKILDDKGYIQDQLQADLDRLKEKGIPKDIAFIQGEDVLDL
ncbi:MAG: Zn-dependent hydrolase, partial [Bacteroidetes bacterium]|nr:Zn-dependent hydrolase [Bacteroidota bacterium]